MHELMSTHCPDQPSKQNDNSQNNRNGVFLLQHSTNNTPYTLRQIGILLTQSNDDDIINPNWVLLDTFSTESVFRNKSLLSDIHKFKKENILKIITNGGSVTYDTVGKFDLFGMPVFFNEQSLVNVLSFKQVAAIEDVRITFDTTIEKAIVVHVNNITSKY